MTRAQALRLAVEALRKQAKRLAVDANLCEHYGARHPAARNAHKKRERLLEAARLIDEEGRCA